jgi:hypothetical protein
MRLGALVGALMAGAAAAQTPLPSDVVSEEHRERFRLCRAAIFFHLDSPEAESRLPHAMAEAMLDQINLIMFETVRSAPAATVADSRRALGFVEQFFLSFSKTIAETRSRFSDPQTREAALLDCMPFIWGITRERVDYLLLWRERAINAPAFPNAFAERLKR